MGVSPRPSFCFSRPGRQAAAPVPGQPGRLARLGSCPRQRDGIGEAHPVGEFLAEAFDCIGLELSRLPAPGAGRWHRWEDQLVSMGK